MRNLILLICAALACCKSEPVEPAKPVEEPNNKLVREGDFSDRMYVIAKKQQKVADIFLGEVLASADNPKLLPIIGNQFEGLPQEQQEVYLFARQLQVEVKTEVLELQKEIRLHHGSQQNEALKPLLKSMEEYSLKNGMDAILEDFDGSRSGNVMMYAAEWAKIMKTWAKLLNDVKQEVSE